MKKRIICILICSVLLSVLTSCDIGGDWIIQSDQALTTEYTLAELEGFINERAGEKFLFWDDESQLPLFYSELNERFPVVVLNPGQDGGIVSYTVYRVSDGGYYYVFFGHGAPADSLCQNALADCFDTEHMLVYDCAYYGALNKKSDFKSLQAGVSTAEDVLEIDPNTQWHWFSARGLVSTSLIRNNKVVEISYENTAKGVTPIEPSQLVIKKIEYVSLEQSSSYFRNVLEGDLPTR